MTLNEDHKILNKDRKIQYGWIQNDLVGNIEGSPFSDYRRLEPEILLERVKLIAPVIPGKIICVGRNYPEHAKEVGAELPKVPILFLKPASTIIGPGETDPASTSIIPG